MTDGERLAIVDGERRRLLSLVAQIRHTLGTPDGTDITHHAAQVAAELQRAREDLTQAQSWAAMLEADLALALVNMRAMQLDVDKWRAVPWDLFEPTTRIAMGDFTSWSAYDEAYDLRRWYYANKPEEVTTE